MPAAKLRLLFLCTGNSCRSQMAEGWTRHLKGDSITPYSAGVAAKGVDPRAVQVMAEAGVDISAQRSQNITEFAGVSLDAVVTVCDHARELCPVFPGSTRVVHVGFDDPPHLARDVESDDEALPHYRRVRDEIRTFVETLPGSITP